MWSRTSRSHSPYLFGLNVDGLAPGQAVLGRQRLWLARDAPVGQLPAGDYFVQAVLNRYEAFHLADGRTLEAAAGQGRGPAVGEQARQPVLEAV